MSTANLVSLSNKQLPFPMRQQVWICLTLVLLKLAERTFSHSLNICTYTPSRLCQKAGDTTTCICKVHLQLYIITPGEICCYPVIQFIQSRSILSHVSFFYFFTLQIFRHVLQALGPLSSICILSAAVVFGMKEEGN